MLVTKPLPYSLKVIFRIMLSSLEAELELTDTFTWLSPTRRSFFYVLRVSKGVYRQNMNNNSHA